MSGITILKKKIDKNTIIFYSLFILLFVVLNFYVQPLVKREYLQDEINKFNDHFLWKINLIICSGILLFVLVFKTKTIQSRGEAILVFLLLVVFTFIFFTKIITNISLYVNQLAIKGKEKEVLSVYTEKTEQGKYIHLSGNKISIHDSDDENLEKIDDIRNKNRVKTFK
ncbi:hypothetical protein HIO71_04885 [Chryseobacterium aquaticum]|uniref:Uncharacterized protein n=1 Tax=Chryseobacterium aquaticum TaxID=452084 RepID=A0A848N4E3_9FLAO|nr:MULTISPECIES: hypothetical protein [Chryseobacterium]NMR33540.1 hypothetical protein [Chryseobacterium aquaticum]NRQ45614.1 hypothetical protein [Chryseobacterium sp. C-204]